MDINCDLGESPDFLRSGHDEALMPYIRSVNIACGFHAGNAYIMKKTAENALKYGLNIGAHPGFNDKINFGRTEMDLSPDEIRDLIAVQLEALRTITGKIDHIKPHGALYNMAARRRDYACAIAEAVYAFDPHLVFYGLSGSLSITEAEKAGLSTRSEVFADRAYLSDGSLAPRSRQGAVLQDKLSIQKQVSNLVNGSPVETLDGPPVLLRAETICVHSDTEGALEIAKLVFETVNGFAAFFEPY